jgi:uncharacterized protein (TIGR02996 family)
MKAMPETQKALLAGICASPDELTPRLVYADWLEEHDQRERAEFIRLGCEAHQLDQEDTESQAVAEFFIDCGTRAAEKVDWSGVDSEVGRRLAIHARLETLKTAHGKKWQRDEVPKQWPLRWTHFKRGFLDGAHETNLRKFLIDLPRILETIPVSHLSFGGGGATDDAAAKLVAAWAGRLRCLEPGDLNVNIVAAFGADPASESITRITTDFGCYPDGIAGAIANGPHFRGVRVLHFETGPMAEDTARGLFRAPHLRRLEKIHLVPGDWSPSVTRLLTGDRFPALRKLALTVQGSLWTAETECRVSSAWAATRNLTGERSLLTNDAVLALTRTGGIPSLRALHLGNNQIGSSAANSLLGTKNFPRLACLSLINNSIRGFGEKLGAGAEPSPLRVLGLHNTRPSVEDLAALAAALLRDGLLWLDLSGNALGDRAIKNLVGNGGFPRLVGLELHENRIGDTGLQTLSKCPGLSTLQVLLLNTNPYGDRGLKALAASPHLGNLKYLRLTGGDGRRAGVRALRKRFGPAVEVL